ncbi:hypothetical protein NKJ87_20085 [Mesorhizobium sp. M0027]|uniref:hypothetical protein n=1 Tax=Mesorhizobium sp. M0027 TaxID=2956848 RepID=UPI0033364B90
MLDGVAANTMSVFQGSAAATGGYEACNVNLLSNGDTIIGNEVTEAFDSDNGLVAAKPMSYWLSTISGGATDWINAAAPLSIAA